MTSQTSTNTYSLPTTLQPHSGEAPPARGPWKSRLGFLPTFSASGGGAGAGAGEHGGSRGLQQTYSNASARSRRVPKWWKIRLFRGMILDVRRRAPFYWSDWKDAWDYRVVPATVYMYFAKYGFPPTALWGVE